VSPLLDNLSAGLARRSGVASPSGWLLDVLGAEETYSGKSVTPTSALSLIPVYSAVTLLAGAVGSLPVVVYKRLDNGRERAPTHRTWKLLHEAPNALMAADEFWEIIAAHLLLWGNAYAAKSRDDAGLVNELIPLRPDRVRVGWDKRAKLPFYVYTDDDGREVVSGRRPALPRTRRRRPCRPLADPARAAVARQPARAGALRWRVLEEQRSTGRPAEASERAVRQG
jgi:hypothetical protein